MPVLGLKEAGLSRASPLVVLGLWQLRVLMRQFELRAGSCEQQRMHVHSSTQYSAPSVAPMQLATPVPSNMLARSPPSRLNALWCLLLALTASGSVSAARSPHEPPPRHIVRSTAGAWQQRPFLQHRRSAGRTPAAGDEDAARCSRLTSWSSSNSGTSSTSPLLSPASFTQRLPPGVDLGREASQWAGQCPALHPLLPSVFAPGSAPARRAASGLLLTPAADSGREGGDAWTAAEQRARREGPGDAVSAHQLLKPDQQPQHQWQQHYQQQQRQQQHGVHQPHSAHSSSGSSALASPSEAAKTADFDVPRARLMAQLQSIGYCSHPGDIAAWNCTRCQRVPDFTAHISHFDEAWDLMGYAGYLKSLNAKVIVFRGTDSSSWYNWAENMRAWRTDASYPVPGAPRSLRIHSGFLVLWNASSMASTFTKAFGELLEAHPTGPTYVLGHSMGGALAHLCALDLKIKYGLTDLKVYTFGAPRVGNSVFADFFSQHIAESWRFTHGRDIVPSVPIQLMGFHHVSREVWLVDVDQGLPEPAQRLVVCDETGEDPSCHNSVCHLGLCTSVADHLTYLGVHMFAGNEC